MISFDKSVRVLVDTVQKYQISIAPHVQKVTENYLWAILQGERLTTQAMISKAFDEGIPIHQIFLEVIQPTLYTVGELWKRGEISIAQEHLATAITGFDMALLFSDAPLLPRNGRKAIVTCLENNGHEIGSRMVADLLYVNGYDALFLGAHIPQDDFLAMVDGIKPAVVCLSATMEKDVTAVRATIEQIHTQFGNSRPTILVGGLAFNQIPDLWQQVGADFGARDAKAVVEYLTTDPFPKN